MIPRQPPFERHADEYDAWYDRHRAAYRSELETIRSVLGRPGRALEVGVGTGRFAGPLGIRFGVDPAAAMVRRARERGVTAVRAVGEHLPFRPGCFDAVLIALTLCFFDSPETALSEVARVLRPDGRLVLGFLDPTSPPGRNYVEESGSPFYEDAELRAPEDVERLLAHGSFRVVRTLQTLTRLPRDLEALEQPRPGAGSGLFVVLKGRIR